MKNEIQELSMHEIDAVHGGVDRAGAERIADGVVGVLGVGIGAAIIVATSPAWVTAVGAAFVVGGGISIYRALRRR